MRPSPASLTKGLNRQSITTSRAQGHAFRSVREAILVPSNSVQVFHIPHPFYFAHATLDIEASRKAYSYSTSSARDARPDRTAQSPHQIATNRACTPEKFPLHTFHTKSSLLKLYPRRLGHQAESTRTPFLHVPLSTYRACVKQAPRFSLSLIHSYPPRPRALRKFVHMDGSQTDRNRSNSTQASAKRKLPLSSSPPSSPSGSQSTRPAKQARLPQLLSNMAQNGETTAAKGPATNGAEFRQGSLAYHGNDVEGHDDSRASSQDMAAGEDVRGIGTLTRVSTAATKETKEWQATIERVVKNVVAIHLCQTCSFDTDPAMSSEATGFVVDAEKGYILTNRVCILLSYDES
jgi:hypothetical protein